MTNDEIYSAEPKKTLKITKGVIEIRKLKDRQHNSKMKKHKSTNNDLLETDKILDKKKNGDHAL
jgi:hypothetical protein